MVSLLVLFSFMPQKRKNVVFFGDSITQAAVQPGGYITLIDSMCKAEGKEGDYNFIGAGISGNKVYDLYLRIENDVLEKDPDIVIIYIGINDVWHKVSSGTGTDPVKFERFYQAIIDKIYAKGSKLILCTPSVIGEKNDFSNQQDGDLNEYSKIVRKLAEKNKCTLTDLRQIFLDYELKNNKGNQERGVLTGDRVHLNAAGNSLVAKNLWGTIKSL